MTQFDSQQTGGIREGDVLAGKYRIEKILGVGGMGIVVAAYHLQLDERVAVKFLLPAALSNEEAVTRFAREARAAVKIKSEHVARVIDVGSFDNGVPYMVMEYLDGMDLTAVLQQESALPIEQAVEFVLQACEAIAEAHGLGIVHRDLKPANLFRIRRADGLWSIKVLDFGISKLSGLGGSGPDIRATATNAVFGTPLYMSPEQMTASRNVDSRTDIWALGAILFELLTRHSPFDSESLPEVFVKISTRPPPSLRDSRPDAPPGIENVILKCLEKDRNNRYANVAELAVALAPYAPKRARASVERISRVISNAGISTTAVSLPPSSDVGIDLKGTQTAGAWGQTSPPSNSRRNWAIGGVVFAVVGAAAAIVVMRAPPSASPLTSPATAVAAAPLPEPTVPTVTAPEVVPVVAASAVVVPVVSASAVEPAEHKVPYSPVVPAKAPAAVKRLVPAATKTVVAESKSKSVPPASVEPAKAAPAAGTKPGCNPPYRFDANGRKRFKPECY